MGLALRLSVAVRPDLGGGSGRLLCRGRPLGAFKCVLRAAAAGGIVYRGVGLSWLLGRSLRVSGAAFVAGYCPRLGWGWCCWSASVLVRASAVIAARGGRLSVSCCGLRRQTLSACRGAENTDCRRGCNICGCGGLSGVLSSFPRYNIRCRRLGCALYGISLFHKMRLYMRLRVLCILLFYSWSKLLSECAAGKTCGAVNFGGGCCLFCAFELVKIGI